MKNEDRALERERRAYNEYRGAKKSLDEALAYAPISDSGTVYVGNVEAIRLAVADLSGSLERLVAVHTPCDCGPNAECSRCPGPAVAVQEWGSGPGQRPVPCGELGVAKAFVETMPFRIAYEMASKQAAQAGHPDPHGAALTVLLAGKRGGT